MLERLVVKILKVDTNAIIPKYAHEGDAGVDLFSVENYSLGPGEIRVIKTGLKMEIPRGYEMQVRPKSGLAAKYGITVLNSPGTIDSPYRGEVGVILINHGQNTYEVKTGEKIAQGVFTRVENADFVEVQELSETVRGSGGFGSTGEK